GRPGATCFPSTTLFRSEEMAAQGYVGFAIDVYGRGNRGRIGADNSELMAPFINDRALLARRLRSALDTATSLPFVDSRKAAVVRSEEHTSELQSRENLV